MNKFDEKFFSKYVSSWTKINEVVHKHIIVIIDKIILTYFFGAILPSFLYYYSDSIKSFIPFFVLEIFIIWVFIKWIYDIFDWYNDVWILTDNEVIDLEWSLFSSDSVFVKYDWIEGLQLIETWFIDTILNKWDIVINKLGWWWQFLLEWANNPFKNIEKIDKICNEIRKNRKEKHGFWEQNFETVLKALSGVVEEYLWKSWYKKDDSEEKKALIKEVKKKWGVIDLTK